MTASLLAHEEQFGLNPEGADIRSQNVLTFMAFRFMRFGDAALQEEGQSQSGQSCHFQAVSALDDCGNCCCLFGVA